MPIDATHAGRSYPPTAPYEVSAAKIAEFSAALSLPGPVEGPGPDVAVPPTFAVVVASAAWDQLFTDPELDLALRRVVHAEQSFRWHRPLRAGDVVTARLTIDKVRSRGTADIIATSAVVATLDGEPVVTAGSTFFHTRAEQP